VSVTSLSTGAVPEITVGHRPFSEQNHILTDYFNVFSQTSDKQQPFSRRSQINRCHIELIAYVSVAKCSSNDQGDDGAHRMILRDSRQQVACPRSPLHGCQLLWNYYS